MKGMHLNHDFYVVVDKHCRIENAFYMRQQHHKSRDSNAFLSFRSQSYIEFWLNAFHCYICTYTVKSTYLFKRYERLIFSK